MNPPQPWRTFSIFISSTFADMQAERDHLKTIVFPKIEEELRKKRITLEIVDLRWGVDIALVNEGDREATVLKVCLDEIRRCKPFFIGLLGDRYGWVPPEERMKIATIGENLILPDKGKSVTALEIEFGVLASKDQLSRSVFYFRDPLPYDDFTPEKAALFCDDFGPELTAEEKAERKENFNKLKIAIRKYFEGINQPTKAKANTTNKFFNAIKAVIKKPIEELSHSGKAKPYTAKWDKDQQLIYGLEKWGQQVAEDILAECATHASDTWNEVPKNLHEEQLALLDAFIESHTHVNAINTPDGEIKVETFCGREKLLGELRQFLLSFEKGNSGKVLTGESGSGKSAVFAMVYRMMQREDCLILAHAAGISPDARKVMGLLQNWNKQLADFLKLPQEEDTVTETDDLLSMPGTHDDQKQKTGIEKLQERFRELLFTAAEKTRIVLLVDSLDSFEPTERAMYMTWLPAVFPVNAKLLVTAITETEKKAVEFNKTLETLSLDNFTPEEAAGMLKNLCQRLHKTLSPTIESLLLSKMRADGLLAVSSPLWLSLAVNNLMAIDADDFEKIYGRAESSNEQIEGYLQEMAANFKPLPGELFLQLIERAKHLFISGADFTKTIFNAIACSRGGLRESDLEAIINATPDGKWDALQFANLRRWFKFQFKEQGERKQWNFAHSILRNTVKEKMDAGEYNSMNASISTHLLALLPEDTLRVSETMYHLLQVDDKKTAIIYYASELGQEALDAATKVLAEAITSNENELEKVASFPVMIADDTAIFPILLTRFAYTLNDYLEVEGNLPQRLTIIKSVIGTIEKSYADRAKTVDFRYYKNRLASSYLKLGQIHQSMGHIEDALNYFEIGSVLWKELYEAYPQNEGVKFGLAISYERLGQIHYKMTGHIEKALDYFNDETMLFEELSEADSHNEEIQNALANSYSKLGDIHQAMGHIEKALNYFEKNLKLNEDFYEANPYNKPLKAGLAISYERLGSIHETMGHLSEAMNYFEKYLALAKELNKANPLNESRKNGLAIAYSRLGSIHQIMGHLTEALDYSEKCLVLTKELYKANPYDESFKAGLAFSHEGLGSVHQSMGQREKALNNFEEEVRLYKELYKANPQNESLKDGLAISYSKLGEIHQVMGDMEKALNYFEKDLKLNEQLYEANSRNESIKNGLAISYERLGTIHQAMGHMKEALNYFEKDLKLTEELYEANPRKESLKDGIAISYLKLGEIHQAMGGMEEALKYFDDAARLFEELYEANPNKIQLLVRLGISYYRLSVIYKAKRNDTSGIAYFSQWKNVTEFLTDNFPQVSEYKEWDKLKYY